MLKTAFAVLLSLSAASPAFAQSDEGEYWMKRAEADAKKAVADSKAAREAAAKAAAEAKAAASSPCAENPELNGPTGFLFAQEGKNGLKMSFLYSSCRVEDTDSVENRPMTPRAVRVYYADQAGYELWVTTEKGAKKSWLTVVENWAGSGPHSAGQLGERSNAELVSKKVVELGKASISDTRGSAKTVHSGKATIQAAQFTPPSNDEPTGCQ